MDMALSTFRTVRVNLNYRLLQIFPRVPIFLTVSR